MANDQQIRVGLQFKGDTSDVEKKLQQLQNTLSGITSGKSLNNLTFGSELNKAIGDATKLQAILKNTTMANGNLDLTKFRSELQKSGLTVKELGNSLLSLGPQGSQAFSQLTQSIINAEVPLKRTSTLLSNFATTLKNTAKWQISSSILHGFMSSISSAYNYAQDLNESLNNIRIVSKQNTDQMAEFAQEANKAAKELSVTTTAYTDAALIFYQQGLEGDAVTERTDVVAKMSNVTRDSVDEVSSYMTAIWNNFDDGSQSLEHYADVITGLGAATASSSAEIAAGLEKFAAVADTVGLSYDYATSALATVVAQTRQSADTVGTAFKTLFARIEGLKLGETLEDGVDLNKYSEALAKIGVNVLDANGQLKNMDDILDDMGAKWGQISKAQQVAIAQTVAGTRQYNQLVALMDNWDKVQDNLQIARSSDGELQAQADIYAESWEAAQKRVRAAWESIYSSLFDDEFFIKLTNGLGSFIEGIDKVIKSLGGLKGILPIITAGLINLFNKDIANGINNFVYNLQIGTKKAQNELIDFKSQFSDIFKDFTLTDSFSSGALTDSMSNQATLQQAILEKQKQLNAEGKDFSETEKLINQILIERVSLTNQEMVNVAKETEALQNQLDAAKKKAELVFSKTIPIEKEVAPTQQYTGTEESLHKMSSAIGGDKLINDLRTIQEESEKTSVSLKRIVDSEQVEKVQTLQTSYGSLTEQFKIFIDTIVDQGPEAAKESLIKIQETALDLGQTIGEDTEAFGALEVILDSLNENTSLEQQKKAVLEVTNVVETLGEKSLNVFESIVGELEESKKVTESDIKVLREYFELLRRAGEQGIKSSNAKFNADVTTKMSANTVQQGFINNRKNQQLDIGSGFANATKAAMNFGTALNSINTLLDKLLDSEATFGEKMLAILTNGSMAVMMLSNSFSGMSKIFGAIGQSIGNIVEQSSVFVNEIKSGLADQIAKQQLALEKKKAIVNSLTQEKNILKGNQIIENATLAIQELETAETQKKLLSEGIIEGYRKGEVGLLGTILALEKAETLEDSKQLLLTALKEKIEEKIKKIKDGFGKKIQQLKIIAEMLGLTLSQLALFAAAIVAIGVAIAIVYKNYQNNLKKTAEEDRKHLETINEKRAALEEEAEKVHKLSEEYQNLISTQNDLSPEELKNQVYNLCMQYGEEELAVKALAGAYEDLEQAIANVEKQNAGELKTSAERTKRAATASARSNAIVAAGHRADNFGDTIDLQGLGATISNTENGRLKTSLQELGLDISAGGQVDTDQLISVILEDSEAFQAAIESSNAKAAKTLKHIYDSLNKEIEMYNASNESLKKAIINSYDINSIRDVDSYINAINNLANEGIDQGLFKGKDAEEQARKWAKQALTGISDEIDQFAQKNTIIEALVGSDATKEAKEKITKVLESLPKEVSEASIAANINLIKVLGDGDIESGIKKFATRFKELVEYNTTVALGNSLNNVLTKEDPIDESDISQLYDQGFNPGIAQDQFMNLDTEQQLLIISNYYMNVQQMSEETRDKVLADLESQINEMTEGYSSAEDAIAHYEKQATNAENRLAGIISSVSEWASKEYKENWDQAYIERLAAAEDELTEEEKANKKFMEDREKLREYSRTQRGGRSVSKDINDFKEQLKESQNYKNSLIELSAELNSVKTSSENLASVQIGLDNAMKLINERTDNIQQAFQELTSTVEEYNENGFVTMDTLQKLWQMDNQYLASLELVDGQLKLNEKTFEVLANAQIDTMEAEALLQLQTDLLTQSENDEANTASAIAAGGASKIGTLAQVIAKVKEGSAAWREYATEQAIAMTGNANLNDNQKNAIDAFYNKITLAESFRKQIGTKNFGTAMNAKSGKDSGSKKDKEEKELKEWADEFDRFYPYQKVINDLTDAISDLAKEQEHLAGGELVGSIRYQNKLLQEQKKAYQELAKEQKKYQKEMQADLAKYGMSFDTASGNIVNYAQSTQAMLDQYNAAIEKYNKSAQSDADKKALEAVEKEYEKFKKLVSNYQGILTEIQDTENNLDDIYYETIANNLKEFEIMVQVNLDIKEAERMVNDFISKINKNFKTLRKSTEEWMELFDTALKNANTYVNGEFGTINVDMDALNKVKNAIDSGDYGHEGAMFVSETEAIMKYKELAEQLKDDANDLYELYKQAWEDYIDAIDESIEAWEDIIDNFDDINDTLDHYEKVIELLHGHQDTDQGYEELISLYNKQMELQLAKQATLRKQIETMQKEYDELIAQGAKENDKDVKAIKEAIDNANKSLQGSIEDYLETINKAFSKQVEKYGKDRMKAALGFDPDEFTESWDKAKKAQQGYYDANERIYQLDKINRKFNQAIDETKDIKLQKQLIKLRDEENKRLEEKKVLSEADVAIAEKKLAVEQARIALEEAQNNKSQMRLQRDSQGNWSYQFVADEDNIAEKQQALMDASNELYQTTKQAAEDCVDRLREIFTSWSEEYIQIMNDTSLNDEQRMQKLQELDDYYTSLINQNTESLNGYKQELGEATAVVLLSAYEVDKDNYEKMTQEQKDITDELRDHNIKDISDIATANEDEYTRIQNKVEEVNKKAIAWWDELTEVVKVNAQDMEKANDDLYNKLQQLIEEYNQAVKRSEEASGIAWSNVRQAVDDTGKAIDEVTNKVEECVAKTQALSDFRARINEIEEAWYSVKDSIEEALSSLKSYLERLREVKDMQDEVKRNETEAGAGSFNALDLDGGGTGPGGDSSYSSSKSNPQPTQHYITSVYTQPAGGGQYNLIGISDSGAEKKLEGPNFYTTDEIQRKKSQWVGRYTSYDTGGYTGNWNADSTTIGDKAGKLAVLHQKELVLNQGDTKNILDAVQLVRDMNSSNNDFANYIAESIEAGVVDVINTLNYGIHMMVERSSYMSSVIAQALEGRSNSGLPLEQNVHISASFPNATDKNEIQDAFNNLINVASQRIGSYNRVDGVLL